VGVPIEDRYDRRRHLGTPVSVDRPFPVTPASQGFS
jgi:hypothetical protein